MKIEINYLVVLLSFIIIVGCTAKNNFQFKGEYPDWEYTSMYNEQEIIHIRANDSSLVNFRNRIFVTIDTSLNILLNNHQVSIKEFEENFEYVYTNPDKYKHLPETPEKAVVCLALNMVSNFKGIEDNLTPSLAKKKKQLDVSQVQLKMLTIIQNLQEEYVKNHLGVELSDINDSQQISIEQKFPLNIAIYSIALEESRKQMNKGITSKLQPWERTNGKLKKRNIIKVLVNDKNELYLQEKLFRVEKLTETVKKMILNIENNPDFPKGPKQAIVSLKNGRKTDYDEYLKVYNALKKVYTEIWEEKSQSLFGKSYDSLSKEEIRKIKSEIPFVLLESEPTDFGE